jgi:RNA polymerase sigma-70 factor (ECF subfamily)
MPADPELDRLLDAVARGSADARGRVLTYYRDRLKRAVAARLDPRLAARLDPSDVVQDVLTEAARGLDGYLTARPAEFYVWVRGIAERRLIDLHRRHLHAARRTVRREARPPASGGYGPDRHPDDLTSPSRAALKAEQAAAVRAALGRLSPDDREVLMLRYVEQLSLGDTATVLGISRTAAKSRHLRALERLTAVLADGSEGEP